ncbi:unnamed protein product [marine sediment metagenome]|uniref:Uncharacterized protein n=1 Tax=marine sediment metagenome TaxID=412755 RepID=X0ZY01_9ZZZZ
MSDKKKIVYIIFSKNIGLSTYTNNDVKRILRRISDSYNELKRA